MQSTLSMKDTDPHDIFAIEPSFAPTAAQADGATLAPDTTGVSGLREPHFGPGIAAPPAAPTITPLYRAGAAEEVKLDDLALSRAPQPRNKWAIRAFWFVFAIASAMGAAAWEHYGHHAKQVITAWTPHFALLSSLTSDKPTPAAEPPGAPAEQAAATDPQAAQAASTAPAPSVAAVAPAVAPVAAAAPAATALTAEQTQLLQSMARDLSSMGQQIEQLKASIDQLKASQDQLSQRVAKTAEARPAEAKPAAVNPALPPRPRPAAVSPHAAVAPASAPVRRPVQAYIPPPTPTATAAPAPQAAPVQIRPSLPQSSVVDADDEPVVRPPMPLR